MPHSSVPLPVPAPPAPSSQQSPTHGGPSLSSIACGNPFPNTSDASAALTCRQPSGKGFAAETKKYPLASSSSASALIHEDIKNVGSLRKNRPSASDMRAA